jgi:hypothetical protein
MSAKPNAKMDEYYFLDQGGLNDRITLGLRRMTPTTFSSCRILFPGGQAAGNILGDKDTVVRGDGQADRSI